MKTLSILLFYLIIGNVTFAQSDSVEILLQKYKDLHTKGLISQEEYDKLRRRTLDIDEPTSPLKPTKEIINTQQVFSDTFKMSAKELYTHGYNDARKNFRTGGVFGGTFTATLFGGPLIGLIPAISCSSSAPKDANFISPTPELLNSRIYKKGYMHAAKREKVKSAWIAWGSAFFIHAMTGVVAGIFVGTVKK